MNFYDCFISHCVSVLLPINNLLAVIHGNKSLQWNEQSLQPFLTIKQAIADLSHLAHVHHDTLKNIMMDASDTAGEAVLQQKVDDQRYPIAFSKRSPLPKQGTVILIKSCLLSMYLAIKHFLHFIKRWEFYICTDHSHSPRQLRYLDFISQFTSDIYIKDNENHVADVLSTVLIGIGNHTYLSAIKE